MEGKKPSSLLLFRKCPEDRANVVNISCVQLKRLHKSSNRHRLIHLVDYAKIENLAGPSTCSEILIAELTQICFLENLSRSVDDVGRVRLLLHHNSISKLQPSPALRLLEGDQVFYNKYNTV